jgi:hypothetical protein
MSRENSSRETIGSLKLQLVARIRRKSLAWCEDGMEDEPN